MDLKVFLNYISSLKEYTVSFDNFNRVFIKSHREYYKPVIVIQNTEVCEELIKEYFDLIYSTDIKYTTIDDRYDETYYAITLFNNITLSESNCFEDYLQRRITFIKDTLFKNLEKPTLIHSDCESEFYAHFISDYPGLETPYVMIFNAHINSLELSLPMIRYGIDNDTCYIYSVQYGMDRNYPHDHKDFISTVNKVNSGVNKYRNLSPSFIVSFVLFIKLLKEKGINTIKVPDFLFNKYKKYYKMNSVEKADFIANKLHIDLIRLCLRLEMQIEGLDVVNIADFGDSFTSIYIGDNLTSKNEFINRILVNKNK